MCRLLAALLSTVLVAAPAAATGASGSAELIFVAQARAGADHTGDQRMSGNNRLRKLMSYAAD